jgi:hypothetical protein
MGRERDRFGAPGGFGMNGTVSHVAQGRIWWVIEGSVMAVSFASRKALLRMSANRPSSSKGRNSPP